MRSSARAAWAAIPPTTLMWGDRSQRALPPMQALNPKLQATGVATTVARGAWPSAQRACPYGVRRTDEAARAAEEAFARRAHAAPLVRLRKGTLNPEPQGLRPPRCVRHGRELPGAADPMKIQHSGPLGPSKPMEIQHAALPRLSKRSGTILKETHKILRAPRMRPARRPGPANHTKIRHSAFVGPANLMSIQNAALLGLLSVLERFLRESGRFYARQACGLRHT